MYIILIKSFEGRLKMLSRRDLLKSAGAGALALGVSSQPVFAAAEKVVKMDAMLPPPKGNRVVICGGGWAGLTVAKYLKKENPHIEVVLIEKRPNFFSCPISNEWLAGLVNLDFISHDYNQPASKYGYRFVNTTVIAIERDKKRVYTPHGYIEYNYLVLAPGIRYNYSAWFKDDKEMAKYTKLHYPAAFIPGSEHLALKRKVWEFEEGDFIITVPPGAYRCPPAPYERAALIASMIKRNKLKAHIYFIDANERPIINAEGFLSAYYDLYKDVADYITSAQVRDIDVHKRVVRTSHGDFKYDLACIIPPMRASRLLEEAGLLKRGQKWVEVNPFTFETYVRNVFVIGDSAQTYLPKSGYAAHSQGKLLAKLINARLKGKEVKEEYMQMICYAMVSDKEAIMTETAFRYDTASKRFIPTHREDNQRKETTAKRYEEWARGLWRDLFG
jgi:NADH dehydrogenase FAD-containing subunit